MIKNHERKTHTMGPVRRLKRNKDLYIRNCSCGWRFLSTREEVMAESQAHRNRVRAYAKLVAHGHATFVEDRPAYKPARELTAQEKKDLQDFGALLRRSLGLR